MESVNTMSHLCRECKRTNPSEAVFCYYDGKPLQGGTGAGDGASINYATWVFPSPFVFPSGENCRNFLQLAVACRRHPEATIEVLQQGFLESFFGSLGRIDLVMVARAAAKAPDHERGLDELLGKLPGSPLAPAQLEAEPLEKNLGMVPVGEDRQFDLLLTNKGDRLCFGKIAVDDCPWLALGETGTAEKLFQFFGTTKVPVRVRGDRLRGYPKTQQGEIIIESNGGNVILPVQISVPIKPFPEGVLSGAMSPRQLAEKAKAHVKEAAVLIENGSVARWYQANGWTYPVQGPTASGQAAVQQLFETLGLVKPPKIELSETTITLRGKPGERVEYVISAIAQEKRAAVAHGASDQPWLTIGKTAFRGQLAAVPLVVESVPGEPGKTLTAQVKITANGNQRFDVPVTLVVLDGPIPQSDPRSKPTPAPATIPHVAAQSTKPAPVLVMPEPVAVAPTPVLVEPESAPAEFSPFADLGAPRPFIARSPEEVTAAPAPAAIPAVAAVAVPAAPVAPGERSGRWLRLLPVGIIVIGLLTAIVRDLVSREEPLKPLPPVDYDNAVLALRFHEAPLTPDPFTGGAITMRFGLGIPDPSSKDTLKPFKTKLIYDVYGRTCNVVVRIDRRNDLEYMWGLEAGTWAPMKDVLGKDTEGHPLIGARSTWVRTAPPKITVMQIVEIVPGGLSADGSKRLLDTCAVQYHITNNDPVAAHTVALRFLLDTFIGTNDGVPFTIAGAKELCNTMDTFGLGSDKPVPDFISALENQDLNNPGTVAHLNLKYDSGLEPPTRVTLGAWPDPDLRGGPDGIATALGQNTRWEVPIVSMQKVGKGGKGDSAVTLYWDDREVMPGKTRILGFAYGLGSLTGEKGSGQLGITSGGELVLGKEFTLTAMVKNPAPGTTITLGLPKGLQLVSGSEKESVPAIPPGAASVFSPVTWRVKALKDGVLPVKVALSSGATLSSPLVIKPTGIFK
jgi:hypothetical protein